MEADRYLEPLIRREALEIGKMAFVSGPRQVGKTTLALQIAKQYPQHAYYNWDVVEFRPTWAKNPSKILENLPQGSCVVLDEIHKAKAWKNTLKGLYDIDRKQHLFLITGSARLETFRKSGDSLLGRYFHFRLHPYSIGELTDANEKLPNQIDTFLQSPSTQTSQKSLEIYKALLRWSGFPEPYLVKRDQNYNLWSQGRMEDIFRDDLRDLHHMIDFNQIYLLATLIPERVGSQFSYKSLSEDLQVSQPTIKKWMSILENVFFTFRLKPFSLKMARALRKEGKVYLWDWAQNPEPAKKLENFIASHLFKAVEYWSQSGLGNYELCFYRDKEKREVDFVVTRQKKPWLLIEAKSSNTTPHSHLRYLKSKWPQAHAIQLIEEPNFYRYATNEQIHVISMVNFLEQLP